MLQEIPLEEPLKESSQRRRQPQPDPFLVSLIETIVETVEVPKQAEGVEEPKQPENGTSPMEQTRKAPTPRVRFNLD